MKLKSTNLVAFKGTSVTQQWAPLSVLVGNNFTHKSSRTEGYTLSVAGYLPGVEKLPAKIHERLASAPLMSVQTDFDDGKFIRREYTKAADGSVARNYSARGLVKGWAVDPVLIDANEFLGLSSDGRVKFLFQHLTMTGEVVTPATLFEQLGKTDIANSEEAAQLISALDESITTDHEQAVTAGLSPQLWLERLVADITGKKNEAVKTLGILQKGALVENLNRVEMVVMNPTAIKKALEDAKTDLKAKQEALTAAKVARAGAQPALSEAEERRNVNMAENSLGAANRILEAARAELMGVQTLECCDRCGAKNKGWRAKIEKAAQVDVGDAEKEVAAATDVVNKCGKALQAKQAMIEQAKNLQFTELDAAVKNAVDALMASESAHATAEENNRKLETQQQEEHRRKQQARNAVVASTKAEVFKAFAVIAQDSLDGMVANSITPFLDKVNELCAGILLAPIGYQGGELGMVKPAGFIGWRSFSGAERSLFLCGVQIALATEGALRVAVLDELGRLDSEHKVMVTNRLADLLLADKLDNAIVIDAGSLKQWQQQAEEINQSHPGLCAVTEVTE
jgi:hypothetical protein